MCPKIGGFVEDLVRTSAAVPIRVKRGPNLFQRVNRVIWRGFFRVATILARMFYYANVLDFRHSPAEHILISLVALLTFPLTLTACAIRYAVENQERIKSFFFGEDDE